MNRLLLLCLFAVLSFYQQVHAQTAGNASNAYFVQIATYTDPQYNDFDKINKLGYLFSEAQDNGLYKVLIGTYSNYNAAKKTLAQVQAKGYKDAFVLRVPIEESDAVHIIQLATLEQNETIYWADWQRLTNNICIQLSETQLRVAAGPYYSQEEANEALQALLKKGARKDIFIRRVSQKALHTLSPLEISRYKPNANAERNSVKAMQGVMNKTGIYTGIVDGVWGDNTKKALEKFKATDETYLKYKMLADQQVHGKAIDPFTLQYYINLIDKDPLAADEGLKQFQHPLAKAYRAYMYLNNDIKIEDKSATVNNLMNSAAEQTFKGYRPKTRYDFSMKYAYDDLSQLIKHLRAIHEAVKDEPDVPCWMFRRHPFIAAEAFAPYWNNERDEYNVSSDCGSFLDLPQMRVLLAIAQDMSAGKTNNLAKINQLYAFPQPLQLSEIKALEEWNSKIWKNLDAWGKENPLQEKTQPTLKLAYNDALRGAEDYFLKKGFSNADSRALGIKTLKYAVGCSLDAYCKE